MKIVSFYANFLHFLHFIRLPLYHTRRPLSSESSKKIMKIFYIYENFFRKFFIHFHSFGSGICQAFFNKAARNFFVSAYKMT